MKSTPTVADQTQKNSAYFDPDPDIGTGTVLKL